MEFKDRIKELRTEQGITYTDLGHLLAKTESATRAWELGRSKPDADTLIKLAKYFDCSTDYLLGLSDYKTYSHKDQLSKDFEKMVAANSTLKTKQATLLDAFGFCIRSIANLNYFHCNDLHKALVRYLIRTANASNAVVGIIQEPVNTERYRAAGDHLFNLMFGLDTCSSEIRKILVSIYMENYDKLDSYVEKSGLFAGAIIADDSMVEPIGDDGVLLYGYTGEPMAFKENANGEAQDKED